MKNLAITFCHSLIGLGNSNLSIAEVLNGSLLAYHRRIRFRCHLYLDRVVSHLSPIRVGDEE